MSAPLVVNTNDGTVWTRRAATRAGEALYAMADCARCPEMVMATYAELAEHGIVGSADVLPVPVGPEPQPSELERLRVFAEATALRHEEIRELLGPVSITTPDAWDLGMAVLAILDGPVGGEQTTDQRIAELKAHLAAKGQSIQAMVGERTALLARVTELEAERHVTNKALDDAVQALRAGRDDAATLPWAHAMSDHDLNGFLDELLSAASGRWQHSPEVPNRVTLAEIEKACARWKTPGEGRRLDGSEFDGVTVQIAPSQALREVPDGEHWSNATWSQAEQTGSSRQRAWTVNELVSMARLFGVQVSAFLPEIPACPQCAGEPPAGFTCNTCGAGGAS